MLRSAAFSVTTGMWLASAKEATRRRNASPICCRHAGDGTGYPRWLQELDHLPADLQLAQVAVQVEAVQALQVQLRHDHPAHRSP